MEPDRVIYLDYDSLVISSIDYVFDCGTFCALIHDSDHLNLGILVVEPSKVIFDDMTQKMSVTKNSLYLLQRLCVH